MPDREKEMIESVRRACNAFSSGDFDVAIQIAHPDVVFIPPGGQSPLNGAAAMRAWMEPDAIVEQHIDLQEITVHGDKVLVRQTTRARGALSGIELDASAWVIWTFGGDGRVTRIEAFLGHEKAKALEAAGSQE